MKHDHLFAFESDFVATLRCVPMAVRLKLDRIGIKLTLRQWSRFAHSDRHELLTSVCEQPSEIAAYKERVGALVALRTGEQAAPLLEPVTAAWAQSAEIPSAVAAFAKLKGVRAPDVAEWAALSQLQRFVLVKLSRDNHDNVNFVPALAEFGFPLNTLRVGSTG